MTDALFELHDVSATLGKVEVMRGLALQVTQGKTTVLIGPSGCGKSTCLRLLLGLITPTRGVVRFHGQTLSSENLRAIRQRIGYVIQSGGLFPHLTARQNITLLGRVLGRSPRAMNQRVAELAAATRFPEDALDRYPAELSGGQRQRVALMRALCLDPEALLLDEPLGALDPMIRYDLQRDLREIFRTLGKTVVIVTHDLAEARYLGDEIVLMQNGTIVQQGRLEDMVARPASDFVTRFITAQRGVSLSDDGDRIDRDDSGAGARSES